MKEQQNFTKPHFSLSTKITLVLLGIFALVGIGYGAYQVRISNTERGQLVKESDSTSAPAPTSLPTESTSTPKPALETKEFTLRSGTVITVPNTWKITLSDVGNNVQRDSYTVNSGTEEIFLSEYNVSEWLKGPDPDEGYVIDAKERAEVVRILKNAYSDEQLSMVLKADFKKSGGEFFGYSTTMRVGPYYVASTNNVWRGLAFYNTYGQAPGVFPIYHLNLFNPDKNSILAVAVNLETKPEIEQINKPVFTALENWEQKINNPPDIKTIDEKAHQEFKNLIEKTERNKLSFGGLLNQIDAVLKSAR